MKKIICISIIVLLFTTFCFSFINFVNAESNIFYDDFTNNNLDTSKWLVAKKAWGGNNNGVMPSNVSIENGILKLEAHGDNYTGNVAGFKTEDGKRTGAAIATKNYFASGSYEVKARIPIELGACSAIWTFEYEEYYPGDEKFEELAPEGAQYYVVNHEIDIEMPGRPGNNNRDISYEYALCNSFVGERGNEYTSSHVKLPFAQNDGKFHTYRFDWHTGSDTEEKRVDYYIDDILINTNTTHIPTNEGRFWIGIWFPNGWAGTPDFDTTYFEIDYVKITPFNELGDTEQHETYANDGWAILEEIITNRNKSENIENIINENLIDENVIIENVVENIIDTNQINYTNNTTNSISNNVNNSNILILNNDNTVANKNIPQTGQDNKVIFIIVISSIIGFISYIKYKKL